MILLFLYKRCTWNPGDFCKKRNYKLFPVNKQITEYDFRKPNSVSQFLIKT